MLEKPGLINYRSQNVHQAQDDSDRIYRIEWFRAYEGKVCIFPIYEKDDIIYMQKTSKQRKSRESKKKSDIFR